MEGKKGAFCRHQVVGHGFALQWTVDWLHCLCLRLKWIARGLRLTTAPPPAGFPPNVTFKMGFDLELNKSPVH